MQQRRQAAREAPRCTPVRIPGGHNENPKASSSFYREEFVKRQHCLEAQREYYSERAIRDVDRALSRVMSQLDHLCATADADRVISRLLRQFDIVIGLSDWSEPKQVH